MVALWRAGSYNQKDHILLRVVYHVMPISIAAGMSGDVAC